MECSCTVKKQATKIGKMWKRGKKPRNIHISGVYPLLFPREERKIPGEEENQQDKICKEMQRGYTADKGNENTSHKRDNKETKLV